MTIIINNNGQAYQSPNAATTAGAVVAGIATSAGVESFSKKYVGPIIIKNINKKASDIDAKTIQKGIFDAFEKSNLRNNGTELLDIREVKAGEEIPLANKKFIESLKNLALIFMPKKYKNDPKIKKALEKQLKPIAQTVEAGNNAMFMGPKANKIAVNSEKIGVAAFHEMGHALNYNQSKIWKVIQLGRLPSIALASIFAMTGIIKRAKVEGEEPKNNFDKVTTFIKNNVGKLVTLSFVPIVAEELMASHKGEKLAKQVLSPELLKKVKSTNRIAALSYILVAAFSGIGAYAGSKVRDAIAKPKEIV